MNLVDIVGDRIKKHVLRLGAAHKEWRVLVIDHDTAHLLHYALPMSEVLSQNIAMIERIEEERQAAADFSVVYFVKMSVGAAKTIQKDFGKKMYSSVYVVSMGPIEKKAQQVLDEVAKKVEKRQSKGESLHFTCKAVNFDFLPLCSDVFQLTVGSNFYLDKERYALEVADKLQGLCRTVKAQCTPVGVGKVTKKVVERIDTTGPGKLVVIERGIDLNTPLLHWFTFESLLWDLGLGGPGYVVDLNGRKKGESEGGGDGEGESDEEARIEMSESHTVWESVRNTQLVKTHEILSDLIKDATKSNEKESKTNIKRLVKAIQELPSQTKTLKEIKALMGLLERCVNYFNTHEIKQVAEVEQGIATGKDAAGSTYKKVATKEFFRVLETARLTKEEKTRLYFLLLANMGSLQRNEEKTLLTQGHISKKEVECWEKAKKHLKGRAAIPLTKRPIPIARYTPIIHDVLTAIISKNKKACTHFDISLPETRENLSGHSLRKREFVFRAPAHTTSTEKRPIIIFFIGGVCIAEISEIREIAKNTGLSIIVGSTAVYSPSGFLSSLSELG
ncbi:hypothetical protein NEHOM01_1505 [Nematocida homosporus]|uniref:uncharacterized protein n=1 Tax=Nematocida homosporus TaxID=1912981 RepID=UPI00221FB577|nr:uncharacterized protein NEHOM01_1505 [Nematocida homosporus]KAI5186493.1 hypothetical protein NEHOM01_1505 [Nematocida homosporus]